MPFGQSVKVGEPARDPKELANFRNVYERLLKPAIEQAGCSPIRADSETSAGDIRTDMFFELVTADLVVADVSAANVNVFYELGIRDGVCPRGVFLVRGNWPWAAPFDIAPDRTFTYEHKFFEVGTEAAVQDKKGLEDEVDRLAGVLKQAIHDDQQTYGSPVYSHLPGLRSPVWKDIQIPKAQYFMALRDNWLGRVRVAQEKGRPGHILTLAEDAPTRVYRSQVLFTAAQALIGLTRYDAAEQVLREVLSIDEDYKDARLQLGVVLDLQGRTGEAEAEIRTILDKRVDDALAYANLGHVYRSLWRLKWKRRRGAAQQARQIAKDNYTLAAAAFRGFSRALEMDPGSYFSGLNVVLLLAIIDDLFEGEVRPPDFGSDSYTDLIPIVSFAARCAKRRAQESGNHDDQFWSTTSLSAMALFQGHEAEAHQLIEDACAFPQTTLFQKETLKHRLQLLEELGFKADFAARAIDLIVKSTEKKKTYRKVVLFYGNADAASGSQLPRSKVEAVKREISRRLAEWGVGGGDLGICGGAREGDILFAEACKSLKADVRLLILRPGAQPLSGEIWPGDPNLWTDRFQKLAEGEVEIWKHEQELGVPLDPAATQDTHNRWLLNTVRMEAYAKKDSHLFGLVLWNGDGLPPDSEDPKDPGYFIAGIRSYSHYQGLVEVINTAKLGEPGDSA